MLIEKETIKFYERKLINESNYNNVNICIIIHYIFKSVKCFLNVKKTLLFIMEEYYTKENNYT